MAGATVAAEDKKWKAESDLRTMEEAEMIKADPERMKAVMPLMKEKMQAIMKMQAEGMMEDGAKKRFPKTYK